MTYTYAILSGAVLASQPIEAAGMTGTQGS